MAITFEPQRLESRVGDDEGMLALRGGRLIAILSCLGDLHGDLLGRWYVEAIFSIDAVEVGDTFGSLDEFEVRVARADVVSRP